MEYFARSPEVIAKFAKHYITGESIPKDLLHHALNKKDFFSGMELQHQLLLSAADQVSEYLCLASFPCFFNVFIDIFVLNSISLVKIRRNLYYPNNYKTMVKKLSYIY